MKTTISSGHGKHIAGSSSIIDEVTEARKVVNRVAEIMKELGEAPNIFHDDTSKTQKTNVNTIVKYHNSTTRDKDVSIHFNASKKTDKPVGVEVFYTTDANKELASKVSKAISDASGLKDRGAKHTDSLGFLNGTNKGAILIEVCFIDSSVDVELYKKNFEAICIAIAETLAEKKYTKAESTVDSNEGKTLYYRVIAGSYNDKYNAQAMQKRLSQQGISTFLEAVYL